MADFWRVVVGANTAPRQSSSGKHARYKHVRGNARSCRSARKRCQNPCTGHTHAAHALSLPRPSGAVASARRSCASRARRKQLASQSGATRAPDATGTFSGSRRKQVLATSVFRKTRQIPCHATEHLSRQSRAHASERCQARLTVFRASPPPPMDV